MIEDKRTMTMEGERQKNVAEDVTRNSMTENRTQQPAIEALAFSSRRWQAADNMLAIMVVALFMILMIKLCCDLLVTKAFSFIPTAIAVGVNVMLVAAVYDMRGKLSVVYGYRSCSDDYSKMYLFSLLIMICPPVIEFMLFGWAMAKLTLGTKFLLIAACCAAVPLAVIIDSWRSYQYDLGDWRAYNQLHETNYSFQEYIKLATAYLPFKEYRRLFTDVNKS